jgi:hypothetical protein
VHLDGCNSKKAFLYCGKHCNKKKWLPYLEINFFKEKVNKNSIIFAQHLTYSCALKSKLFLYY